MDGLQTIETRNGADSFLSVNGSPFSRGDYSEYHTERIARTLAKLTAMGAKNIIELGGHPWAMTSALIDSGNFRVCATISAEEVSKWPDEIAATAAAYEIVTRKGTKAAFSNYSANIERTLFDVKERADTVIACEIVEHLVRAPHVMFLNANRWLEPGGNLLVTTPNGSAFMNPFRTKSSTPAYRCHLYERHSYLFTLRQLCDIVALCGFEIADCGYWNVYKRAGWTKIYEWLSAFPGSYWQAKFKDTIFVAARKVRNVSRLERLPLCYEPSPDWEWIDNR